MIMVIRNISEDESKKMVSDQWGETMWEIIQPLVGNEKIVTYPTSEISVELFYES